jgi:hypothetical protein
MGANGDKIGTFTAIIPILQSGGLDPIFIFEFIHFCIDTLK